MKRDAFATLTVNKSLLSLFSGLDSTGKNTELTEFDEYHSI